MATLDEIPDLDTLSVGDLNQVRNALLKDVLVTLGGGGSPSPPPTATIRPPIFDETAGMDTTGNEHVVDCSLGRSVTFFLSPPAAGNFSSIVLEAAPDATFAAGFTIEVLVFSFGSADDPISITTDLMLDFYPFMRVRLNSTNGGNPTTVKSALVTREV